MCRKKKMSMGAHGNIFRSGEYVSGIDGNPPACPSEIMSRVNRICTEIHQAIISGSYSRKTSVLPASIIYP